MTAARPCPPPATGAGTTAETSAEVPAEASTEPAMRAYPRAFGALLARDFHVLAGSLPMFVVRTIMQPLLLVFVFTYVFPKIGQGIGQGAEGAESFTAVLVAGVVGLAIVFQGVQAVALPLVQEFGTSREIEDRVLAPLPTGLVGVQKIVTGGLQGLVAAALVFPIAAVVPANEVTLSIDWPVLITLAPLAGWVAASLGLTMGTRVEPSQVSYLFALVILPLVFLGAIYYPWTTLGPVPWLKWGVLANPLVYMTEGFRAALVGGIGHMDLIWVYTALVGFAVLFTWLGVSGFKRRVVT